MLVPMLYDDLFIRLERARWTLSADIPFDDIDPSLLSPQWISDLRNICLTELSALYATEMFLRDFYTDIDFCSFISIWFYEEMKHHLTLRKYLERCGETFDESKLPELRLTFAPGPRSRRSPCISAVNSASRIGTPRSASRARARHPQDFQDPRGRRVASRGLLREVHAPRGRQQAGVPSRHSQDVALDDAQHQRRAEASHHDHRAISRRTSSRIPSTSHGCSTGTSRARPRGPGAAAHHGAHVRS